MKLQISGCSRLAPAAALLLTIFASADDRLVRETDPLSPQEEQAALKVPDGFEVQLFAAEPMINKPINLAFDDRGRLWVSSTVEYPYAAKQDRWSDPQGTRVRDSRDAIKILEDTDGDGVADKVTDFADRLNIPTGVLPWHKPEHKDGCIAWSIPNIWYFADTTGDGKADHREVLFGPLGWEKDTHGMCSSFRIGPGDDGWVYATHGFNNTSHFEAKDGSTLDLNSGNVFRFRPDGSRIEIWSRGQVNPFGLCFDGRGNLYSADCHSAPVYQLLRGATYPSFGKPHEGLGFGPTMIEHTHGSTGICGIVYIDGDFWGEDWNDQVLIGNPVNSRVNRDKIEFVGSTPKAIEKPDFIESDDPWFRPVDLCPGPDGALYIADFYNRIIGHYEVPLDHPGRDRERGRIWRIIRKGGAKIQRETVVPPVPVRDPIADLASDSPFRQRAAAVALQFNPELEALAPLEKALAESLPEDTHLRHVLEMAIREHLKLPGAFDQFTRSPLNPKFARVALAVGTPEAAEYLRRNFDELAQHPSGPDPERSLTHIARHGDPKVVELLMAEERERSGGNWESQARSIEAIRQGLEERGSVTLPSELLRWAQRLAGMLLDERERNGPAGWTELPHPGLPKSAPPWILQMRKCADGREAAVLSSLRKGEPGAEQRTGILRSGEFAAPGEISFWICGHRGIPDQPAHELNRVRLVLAETDVELFGVFPPRSDVCQFVKWDLSGHEGKPVRLEIIDGDKGKAYAWLGIGRVEPEIVSLESYFEAGEQTRALGQLASMLKITAPADLRDRLKDFLPPAPAPPPLPVSKEERARLDLLIKARSESFASENTDIENGAAVFKTNCAACHRIRGEGGLIGPQLDGIGSRGVARLCEDILDPNRNVDAHFYLTSITLKDGSMLGGFVLAERGKVLHLVDAAGTELRIVKTDIAKRETASMSVMPPAFEKVISETDFRDLLGWLLKKK